VGLILNYEFRMQNWEITITTEERSKGKG